jgi:hypothetical protein
MLTLVCLFKNYGMLGMWHMSVTAALRRLRKENLEFKISVGYIVRTYLKKKKAVLGTGGSHL